MRFAVLLAVCLAACSGGHGDTLDVVWQINTRPASERCVQVGADTVVVQVLDGTTVLDSVTAPCDAGSARFTFDDPPASIQVVATLRGAGADLDMTEATISSDLLDALVVLDFAP